MSYCRASLGSCEFANPASPGKPAPGQTYVPGVVTSAPDGLTQATTIDGSIAQTTAAARAAHDKSIEQQKAYITAIVGLAPSWGKLPVAPYPPASDTSGFPRTGDTSLVLTQGTVNQAALLEPGRVSANLLAQADARRPKLQGLFWVGLACLGVGLYVHRRS